jgi:hypothetical protein
MKNITRTQHLFSNSEFLTILIGWIIFAIYICLFHHHSISYFDSSEYAIHIAGGGIAHAPGYPLYILIGKIFYNFTHNVFLAQLLINLLSSLLINIFVFLSLTRDPSEINRKTATIVCLLFMSGYFIKLYTLLPEVFLLNCAIFSFLAWGISLGRSEKLWFSFGVIGLAIGLGISHHHLILLAVIPTFFALYFVIKNAQGKEFFKACGAGLLGLLIGIAPTSYLFFAAKNSPTYTYFQVEDVRSYFYVLLRQGYGTFKLTSLSASSSLQDIYILFINGYIKNSNIINLVFSLPCVLLFLKPKRLKQIIKTEPLFIFSLGTLLFFVFFFLPLSNIPLKSELYKNILLRFITLPSLLLIYPISISLRESKWKTFILRFYPAILIVIICSNFYHIKELNFSNDNLLEKHLETTFLTAQRITNNLPRGEVGDNYARCVLFSEPDAINFGARYYNQFLADKKCYIYSIPSFDNTFVSKDEDQLSHKILGSDFDEISNLSRTSTGKAFEIFFERLYQKGYKIFLLFPSAALSKTNLMLFPVGNILEIRPPSAPSFDKENLRNEYRAYLNLIESYKKDIENRPLPTLILDESIQNAFFLNLRHYQLMLQNSAN